MKKIRVMSIFGTRPEANKMMPLIKELEKCEHIDSKICVTAQHRQMLDQALEAFDLKPDYDLDIMSENQSLAEVVSKSLVGLDKVAKELKPDILLVHGDTATTFAGALTGFYSHIKVGHVEAGLRTFNKYEPYPEEVNRLLTTQLADLHFAPTYLAKQNLLNERVPEENIFLTGNTAVDEFKYTLKKDFSFGEELDKIDFNKHRVITLTAHRRENLGEPLRGICAAIKRLVNDFDDIEVVYPMHMNPQVRNAVSPLLGEASYKGSDRVHLIEPPDMFGLHNLMNRSYLVMTDSGGIQEEAPSLDKPVLVLRNVTERPEGLTAGALKLAGTDSENIYKLTAELLTNKIVYDIMAKAPNPYGDGEAGRRITEAVLYAFGVSNIRPKEFNYTDRT